MKKPKRDKRAYYSILFQSIEGLSATTEIETIKLNTEEQRGEIGVVTEKNMFNIFHHGRAEKPGAGVYEFTAYLIMDMVFASWFRS